MQHFDRLLPKPRRKDIAPEELADYDHVDARIKRVDYGSYDTPARYLEALMNAPPLAAALTRLGTLVRQGQLRGSYSDAERELVDFVYGADFHYNSIFTVHLPDAFAVGVRPEAIEALRTGREAGLTDGERQIAEFARQVASGTVTDASYAAMTERLGRRGALEFTIFCGFLLMTIRLWQAVGVPEPSDEEMDELFRGLRDGSVPVPDPAARIG